MEIRIFMLCLLFIPNLIVGTEWSSAKGDLKISLEPDDLNIGEKSILRLETPGALIDEKKLEDNLLKPLNEFSEKIKIDSMNQEEGTLTLLLIPLVEGTLSLHLESIPLSTGKMIVGEEVHLKVSMPTVALHRLLSVAAKPLPLDQQPIIGLSGDNRYNYVDGEKALDIQRAKAKALFEAKRFPIEKLLLMLLAVCGMALGYHYRRAILTWLKLKLIPAYNPQKNAQKSITKAARQYGKEDDKYYISLSDTLRQYFGEIFNVEVEDLTTPELLAAFGTHEEMPKESLKDLHDIFVQADQIKFAKAVPTQEAVEDVAAKAMKLIELKANIAASESSS